MGTYHHGDLPRRLLELAAEMAAENGVESVTLRELARKAEVSHSAPVHHFKSRANLLTTLAAQGFTSLNEALEPHTDDIYDMGVAYVLWALKHPGHYAVMWQPHNLAAGDQELNDARTRAWALMSQAVEVGASRRSAPLASMKVSDGSDSPGAAGRANAYAAFSVVHGLSGLWLSGVLPWPADPDEIVGEVTRRLVFTS